jgi:hypothetical protein
MSDNDFVDLDRRFVGWHGERDDVDVFRYHEVFGGLLEWSDLLARKRVVILAEAGSGKSTELTRQVERLTAAGTPVFTATMQSIGRSGFERALGKAQLARFEAWKRADTPGWLILDSIDEAKKADFSFAEVLDEVRDAIDAAASRVHLVLSGRHSDWEFKRDLDTLLKKVAVPPPDVAPVTITPNELLLAAVHERGRQEVPAAEEPIVVVMAALDQERVEHFAVTKGVTDVAAMIAALERQNLWEFARRPVDLDWLVTYWREHHAFGTLAEMLALSLAERLKETNPARRRKDSLDQVRAMEALERIGAALVLQRLDAIAIPDPTVDLSAAHPALQLDDILADWGPEQRGQLITRPVFDPATGGYVRLHNDNNGVVRGYLAARWLLRLKRANAPATRIRDLLFAKSHGIDLVIPSMRQTAAWLALWDPETAQHITRIDPRLLMDAGDPGSLPLAVRTAALDAMLEAVKDAEHLRTPDNDALKRFAKPDLGPYLHERWRSYRASPSARALLVLVIYLGEIREGVELAREAAFGKFTDRYTPIYAGRALTAVGTAKDKADYVAYLLEKADILSPILIWDALEALFPASVTVEQAVRLIDKVRTRRRDGGLGLDYYGARLAENVTDRDQAEALVTAIIARLRLRLDCDDDGVGGAQADEPWLEMLEVAATRLLTLSPIDEAPSVAIDAALRIGENRRSRGRRTRRGDRDLIELLRQSPNRRQAASWRGVALLRTQHEGTAIIDPWQLRLFGLELRLGTADLPWLLDAIASAPIEDDARFAANAALIVWRQDGEDPDLRIAIKAAAEGRPAVVALIEQWFTPRQPSAEVEEYEREHRKHESESAVRQAKADASWIDLAERLRADPDQLRQLPPPTEAGTDYRLFHLWRLLEGLGDNRSRHAIKDLSPLVPLLGEAVVDAVREAFIRYWRALAPRLIGERPEAERNQIYSTDMIGIVGVTQEALANRDWAARLSDDEVQLAVKLATLELNGFPDWLDDLARGRPAVTGEILWQAASGDLHDGAGTGHRHRLSTLASSADAVVATMGAAMLDHVEAHPAAPFAVVEPALRIVRRSGAGRDRLLALSLDRARTATDRHVKALYLAAAFVEDAEKALVVFEQLMDAMSGPEQTLFVQAVLPRVFGGRSVNGVAREIELPLATQERLVVEAFAKIHPDADNDHSNGDVYTPDERDDAADVRNGLFNRLAKTPGLATFEALGRLKHVPGFPISPERLEEHRSNRAADDAETGPWGSADVRAFETDFDTAPSTSADLQRIGVARLGDIEQHLLHGDFNQGLVVARLPNEVDVQNWFANELRQRQGRSYSLEREPHVAEEKEPDIRLQSRVADARSPIEIKVVESCSLSQLEEALTAQLQGRYLRDRDNRFGILLLVHQKARKHGWKRGEEFIQFAEVVEHLRALARKIGAADATSPQMAIVGIDVSAIGKAKAN